MVEEKEDSNAIEESGIQTSASQQKGRRRNTDDIEEEKVPQKDPNYTSSD